MKQLLSLAFLFVISIFFSCNNNNPVTPTNPGSFQGEWTIDKVQMVSAPSGGGMSAMMKQALVPFGEVDGSFAGYLDFKFGAETVTATSTSLNSGESYFVGNIGYYVEFSRMHKSTDGGNSWNQINFPSTYSYINVFARNVNILYVMGYGSGTNNLIKSTDGGITWSMINSNMTAPGSNSINKTFCFVNDNTGYAISGKGLLKTTDGGSNWVFTSTVFLYPSTVKFSSESTGTVESKSSQGGTVYSRTTDGGSTWTQHNTPNDFRFFDSFFLNDNVIWILGDNEEEIQLYKSDNAGQTWEKMNNKTMLYQIKFVNANTGYAITGDNFFVKTTDGGKNWSTYSTPAQTFFYGINIFNEQPVAYTYGNFWRPSGIIDTTKWTANGMITNSAIKLITRATNFELQANGDFNINSNNIIFTVYNYLFTYNKVGTGTFSFEDNYLNVELNLPNNEKWKVKLRRK